MYCIDVILPIPLKQTFTYEVNKDEARFLKPGMRVAVPFGKAKIYTGIVLNIHQQTPQGYEIKSIDQILDEFPVINEFQIQHWQWMASYYLCTLGEVLKAAIPNGFLLESETIITLNTNATIAVSELNDVEFLVLEALQSQPSLHINDIRSILDRKNVMGVLTNLIEKKHIVVQEEVHEKYRPKIKRFIKLSSHYSSQENLKDLLDTLSRAPKQREVIMTLLMLSSKENKAIESVLLQKKSNSNSAVINKLIAKEILEEYFI